MESVISVTLRLLLGAIDNNIMKRVFSTLLLFAALVTTASAQYFPLDTARLNSAYRAIVRGPNTLEKQQDFLDAFPTTYMEFYYTYQYIEGNNYDLAMTRMVNAHLTVLKDSLYLISDSLYCNKLVNLAVGMNDTGEITSHLQEIIHMAMLKHEKTMMFAVMRLFKAYQLQFWSFYWSSVAYSESWTEHFVKLYGRYFEDYPDVVRTMAIAFDYYNGGVCYPDEFPHLQEKRYKQEGYKYKFDDYRYRVRD